MTSRRAVALKVPWCMPSCPLGRHLGCMVCAAVSAAWSVQQPHHQVSWEHIALLASQPLSLAWATASPFPRRPSCQVGRAAKAPGAAKHKHDTPTHNTTHTQHSHTENDTHTDTPRMTHTQTPQARFWTQTLRKGPSGVRRARRTNTPQARLWTQTLRQGPSGVSRDRRTNTRRGRRVRRSKAHLRLAKPVERQHRE